MNHFILSDSRKCIGCQACEVACVMAHNEEQHALTPQRFLPRITVIKAEGQRNAITCRHCEDAPCLRSCPNGAIAQTGDSVQVCQEKCIGCKSCMVACPFGVMEVVVTPQAAGQVKASAQKCDLCAGREAGPACVENCPAQALTLADDEAATMGIDVVRLRRVLIVCATLTTAAAVSIAGIVGWIGLIVPHAARLLVGPEFSRLLPATLLLGGAFLVAADTLARSLATVELPLGILTAFVGAPAFLWLLARQGRPE